MKQHVMLWTEIFLLSLGTIDRFCECGSGLQVRNVLTQLNSCQLLRNELIMELSSQIIYLCCFIIRWISSPYVCGIRSANWPFVDFHLCLHVPVHISKHIISLDVCLSMHRCICIQKKNQLNVTECFIALMIRSICFRHFYAYHQECIISATKHSVTSSWFSSLCICNDAWTNTHQD